MQRDAFTKFVVEHTYWAACAALLRGCRPQPIAGDETESAGDHACARDADDRSQTDPWRA
jgi:hypothetical protein